MHKLISASAMLAATALLAPGVAHADAASDIAALREEIAAIRAAYEARLQALEQRLQTAESKAAAPAVAPIAATASSGPSSGPSAFNPAMSLILSGLYARTARDPAGAAISGFRLPPTAEVGAGSRGFSLAESELGLAASIDPWWRGVANIALHGDDTVSVEEAYVQTTTLGGGLSLKAGRFFSGLGYLNAQHAHTWDFVDNPLAYQAMLGTQYGDDGVQLNWIAPTSQFIELGMEIGRGRGFPGGDNSRNGAGAWVLTAHSGGDIGDSHTWRAGLSLLNAKADDQPLAALGAAGNSIHTLFTGNTRVWVADAVWKWAPDGNATRVNFKLQGEYLRSTRSGSLVGSLLNDPGQSNSPARYRSVQSGWYVQGIYQFMPRWRVGLRGESLSPGTADDGANQGLYAANTWRPRKTSLMLDYSASEFSRVRLQLAQDRSRAGPADQQVFLQYQMSLGAHGAHNY